MSAFGKKRKLLLLEQSRKIVIKPLCLVRFFDEQEDRPVLRYESMCKDKRIKRGDKIREKYLVTLW